VLVGVAFFEIRRSEFNQLWLFAFFLFSECRILLRSRSVSELLRLLLLQQARDLRVHHRLSLDTNAGCHTFAFSLNCSVHQVMWLSSTDKEGQATLFIREFDFAEACSQTFVDASLGIRDSHKITEFLLEELDEILLIILQVDQTRQLLLEFQLLCFLKEGQQLVLFILLHDVLELILENLVLFLECSHLSLELSDSE
jgi:hypothetical protein